MAITLPPHRAALYQPHLENRMWRGNATASALVVTANLDRTYTVERVVAVYQEDPGKKKRQSFGKTKIVANFLNQFSVFIDELSSKVWFSAKRLPELTEGTSLDEGSGTSTAGVGIKSGFSGTFAGSLCSRSLLKT